MKKKPTTKNPPTRTRLIAEFVSKIRPVWNEARENIFALGKLFTDARSTLKDDEYKLLLKELDLHPRTAQRFIKIAHYKRFSEPSIRKLLPPCWGTIHEICQFTDTEFKKAIKDKVISPDATAASIKTYRDGLRGKVSKSQEQNNVSNQPSGKYSSVTFRASKKQSTSNEIIDLSFVNWIGKTLFQTKSNGNIEIDSDAFLESLPANRKEQFKRYSQFIHLARQRQDEKRKKAKRTPLTEIEALLSLLGVDIDTPLRKGLSLMEQVAVSYALRQGLLTNTLLEDHLKNVRPELGIVTESLLKELKESVAAINDLNSGLKTKSKNKKERASLSKTANAEDNDHSDTITH